MKVEFRYVRETFQRKVMLRHFDSDRGFKAKVAFGEHSFDPRWAFKANAAIDTHQGRR